LYYYYYYYYGYKWSPGGTDRTNIEKQPRVKILGKKSQNTGGKSTCVPPHISVGRVPQFAVVCVYLLCDDDVYLSGVNVMLTCQV